MPTWVCRTDCFWRDHKYAPGDTVEVGSNFKWDYSGGYWHPEGAQVIDPSQNLTIPRHFEPTDFSVLVDPNLVASARDDSRVSLIDGARIEKYPRKFKFAKEAMGYVSEPEAASPEPLDPEKLKKKPAAPEKINPGDIGKVSSK